jgi:hypothetical protein
MATSKKVLQQQCIKLGIPFQITTEEIKFKITDLLALDLWKDLDTKGVNAGGNRKELQKRCSWHTSSDNNAGKHQRLGREAKRNPSNLIQARVYQPRKDE